MHVMCFGENEVTRSTTPTALVGTFGGFMSGLDSGGKSVVLSRPSGSRKIKRSNSRRSLDHNIALADADGPASPRGGKASDASPLGFSSELPPDMKREGDSWEEESENRRLSMLSSKSTPPAAAPRPASSKANTKRARDAVPPAPTQKGAEAQQPAQNARKVPVRSLKCSLVCLLLSR